MPLAPRRRPAPRRGRTGRFRPAQAAPGAAPGAPPEPQRPSPPPRTESAAAPAGQPEPGVSSTRQSTGGADEPPADDGWDFEEEDDAWGFEDDEEGDDAWGFEDDEEGDDAWSFGDEEEEAETWGALLRDQAADLVFFTGFAALVMVGFFRKSVPLKYVTLAAAVAYMGFTKSQLISVVNVYGLVTGNMPVFRYSLAWYLFAAFTVVTTVLWGRLYCGRVCAFGALTQLMDRVVPARLRVEVPAWLEQRAAWIKYGLLVAVLLYFLATADIPAYRWVEPFWMFTRRGTTAMWIALAVLLVATVFVRNLYCRFLCPVGAFLGHPVEGDGLPHQAVEGVRHLQDLREGLRVGRHPRTRDRHDRVRPLRRLRAALRRREEVPALAAALARQAEAAAGGALRHPGPAGRVDLIAEARTRCRSTSTNAARAGSSSSCWCCQAPTPPARRVGAPTWRSCCRSRR